ELRELGCTLITGGTENHLLVIDVVSSCDIDGRLAETVLDQAGLTVNKQVIPDDSRPPLRPSGIRIGTPAITARGAQVADMPQLAHWLVSALRAHADAGTLARIRGEVAAWCAQHPIPGL